MVRQALLNILKELVTKYNTHLFITGRGHIESDVQKRFKAVQRYDINASQHDIREFVRQTIEEDQDLNPEAMNKGLAKDIEDTILEKSMGM